MTFPTYIGAMLAAAAIRNIWDVQHKDLPMEEVDALGGLSLNLFLSDGNDEPEAVAVSSSGASDDCYPA